MNKVIKFQELLKQHNIDCYIIPTSDYHQSEYVSDFFKSRAYLSNFTGSAGTLIITQTEAKIWVDGRYFIQAEKQLPTNIDLMKMGTPGYPTIAQYLKTVLNDNSVLAFDGKVLNTSFVNSLLKYINKDLKIIDNVDLINEIWTDRPALPCNPLFILDTKYSGKTYLEKLEQIKTSLKENNASNLVLTSLEDQAWLFNLRGNDVLHTPVFLAYTVVCNDQTYLFIDSNKLTNEVSNYLNNYNIIIKPYNDIYSFIKTLDGYTLMDFNKVNYSLYNCINDKNKIINADNPTLLLKAIKNETEIKNTKEAHLKDGVAMTKFMYYLKNNIGKIQMSEISVSDYLQTLRQQQPNFVDISFDTICAYQANAAMMHYSATPTNNATLQPQGLLLVDSGGHYLEGSTDITRTFALGEITDKQKLHFTTVLQSMINLTQAKFLKGIRGFNLDILARGPIWDLGIDYKCGTGHGIGYLLSVHEAPNGFRYQIVPERNDSSIFVPGMITTNEPGIYLENEYGIRIENELLCIEDEKTEFGEFLSFETITYVPIDLDAIDVNLLTLKQKNWLNNYHKLVFEKLSPYLTNEEIIWLKKYTKEI